MNIFVIRKNLNTHLSKTKHKESLQHKYFAISRKLLKFYEGVTIEKINVL